MTHAFYTPARAAALPLLLGLAVASTGCSRAEAMDGSAPSEAVTTTVSAAKAGPPSSFGASFVDGREPTLEEIRMATARFRDVNVALAEGYIRDPMDLCETAESMGRPAEHGAMGIHFAHPGLLGITAPPNPRVGGTGTHTDFLRPGVLIYEPQADGSLELVAVENLVFRDAWAAAGNAAPPSLHGVSYDLMVDDPATPLDEAHHFEPHYDLHLWLYRDNPRGRFAQFNPDVSCRHHVNKVAHGHAH